MTRRALFSILVIAVLAPPAAQGAGTTELTLRGPAAESLRDQGVRLAAKRPARPARGTLRLPVAGGLVTGAAYLTHRGALVLARRVDGRRRRLVLRRIQLRLGGRSSVIASAGKERITFLRVALARRDLSLNATNGSARLTGARVTLTRSGRKLLRQRLKLRRLPARAFGRLAVDALVGEGGGGPGGGGGGGNPGGPPQSGPITDEPVPLARPARAADVTGAQVTWHVRPSFIRYVNTGEGTIAFGGATDGPATTTPQCGEANEPAAGPFVYSFAFPFARGWYDRPSGSAAVYFGGGVNFSYSSHGIDLDVSEPEIELNGAASRAIFRFGGSGSTAVGGKRGVLVNLDPAAAPPTTTPTSVSYERIPGTIPTGGAQTVFAGFYPAGAKFGCVTVSFTHPPIP